MTDQEILTKAFECAISKDYSLNAKRIRVEPYRDRNRRRTYIIFIKNDDGSGYVADYRKLIFESAFAKAVWSDTCYLCMESLLENDHFCTPLFEHHLAEMKDSEDSIQYLGKNL